MNDIKIKIYGSRWCGDTRRAMALLESLKIKYEYYDVDESSESERIVREINHGNRSVPTIIFEDGSILVEPNQEQLEKKLSKL